MIATTLATASHLPQAIVALNSLRDHNPEIEDCLLLLIDARLAAPASAPAGIRVIGLDALGDADRLARMRRYYSTFEFCNAVKPWLHQFIAQDTDVDRWLYVDADTWCVAPLAGALDPQAGCSVRVTRHTWAPSTAVADIERDLALCGFGTVNGGVVVIRRTAAAMDFVRWWQARLVCHGRDCVAEGEYVDQRWLEVALNYFPEIQAERIAGVNIGHWNLHELMVRDGVLVDRDEKPCALLHFSNVRVTWDGSDCSRLPASGTAVVEMFRRAAADYAVVVRSCSDRLTGQVALEEPAITPLDDTGRDIVIRAVRGGDDEATDFAAIIAALPAARRARAWREWREMLRLTRRATMRLAVQALRTIVPRREPPVSAR